MDVTQERRTSVQEGRKEAHYRASAPVLSVPYSDEEPRSRGTLRSKNGRRSNLLSAFRAHRGRRVRRAL